MLDVEIEGSPLEQWPMRELRRRHAFTLVDHMLRVQGRATTGVVGILRSLSAMAEDAITDEVADLNPFKGARIRAIDPRAKKKRRPIRVFSFEQMHAFAKAAGRYEAMVRVFTDTGMRLGEVLPLRVEDFDGETLRVRRTAHEGAILRGTKTDHGEHDAGRTVPVPATLAWMLELNGPDCELLFTTPTGRTSRERSFYRDVWRPAQEAPTSTPAPTRAATATSPTCAPPASMTPTWPRSPGIGSRRCWRGICMRWETATSAFAERLNSSLSERRTSIFQMRRPRYWVPLRCDMRFAIWKSKDGQYYFLAKGDNGQTMATSETYTRKASAEHAIEVIKDEAAKAGVLDMTK